MGRVNRMVAWFFTCLGVTLVLLAALATPELAFADGASCASGCSTSCTTSCSSLCGCDTTCMSECMAGCLPACDGGCCNTYCSGNSSCMTTCCTAACGDDSNCINFCQAEASEPAGCPIPPCDGKGGCSNENSKCSIYNSFCLIDATGRANDACPACNCKLNTAGDSCQCQ
jgi:hypothetical protein